MKPFTGDGIQVNDVDYLNYLLLLILLLVLLLILLVLTQYIFNKYMNIYLQKKTFLCDKGNLKRGSTQNFKIPLKRNGVTNFRS